MIPAPFPAPRRRSWTAVLLLSLILSWPVSAPAQAPDIAGVYAVTGQNPDGTGQYRGEVTVARAGDAWAIVWRFGEQRHAGTGILRGGRLSVVYQPQAQPPGVAVFELSASGTLSGLWTGLGGRTLGTETWTPRGRS